MEQGKYSRPRRRKRRLNPRFVMLLLILVALIAILGTVLLRSCRPESTAETIAPSIPETTVAPTTKPASKPTTAPTTVPTTAPTEPATEATTTPTEATTEATTEPTTEPPTEPPTEAPTAAPTEPPVPASSSVGAQVAQIALEQIGKPYAYGGVGPDSFDASGLAVYCYGQNGITIPRTTDYQMEGGTPVPSYALEPGDIVIFWSETPGAPEYEGIYIGNGKFVAARNGDKPVAELDLSIDYFAERYLGACRFY